LFAVAVEEKNQIMNVQKVSAMIGERELSIEIGKLAKQSHGSALVRYGDTVVLVTACATDKAQRGRSTSFRSPWITAKISMLPGRFPEDSLNAKGKPSEREVLNSRMIDRPVRPLFDDGFKNETQVIALVLSADPEVDPGMHAIVGASTALFVSNIPFNKPVGAVRVGLIDGRYVINPSYSDLKNSRLNLAVAGMEDGIVMVECGAQEVSEEIMVER
jgi:polyribonucleotide nucleotidyltransferase